MIFCSGTGDSFGHPAFPHLRAAVIVAIIVAALDTVSAQDAAPVSRVRSSERVAAAAVRAGVEYSPTFAGLIRRIDATDGLVYIEEGTCGHGVQNCLTSSVQISGPYRVLRIVVKRRKRAGCALVASVGHELQHAIEVLSDPRIRSNEGIFFLFFGTVSPTFGRFETGAADRVGASVNAE